MTSLIFAALVGFLMVVKAGSANPWGISAGLVGVVTLTVSGINDLRRRPNPVVTKDTSVGYLIGSLIVVAWTQARPNDLVSSRMPSASSVRTAGLVVGVLLLAPFGLLLVRRLRSRTLSRTRPTSFAGRATFTLTGRGYDAAGVDNLLARLAALPDTPEGRNEGRAQIAATRFHLAKGSGYEPRQVDRYLDRLFEEPAEIAKPLPQDPLA